jgi:hypothetical protein
VYAALFNGQDATEAWVCGEGDERGRQMQQMQGVVGAQTQGWPSQLARPRKASRVSMCGNGHHGQRIQDWQDWQVWLEHACTTNTGTHGRHVQGRYNQP